MSALTLKKIADITVSGNTTSAVFKSSYLKSKQSYGIIIDIIRASDRNNPAASLIPTAFTIK